jgi:hypothetical protein
MAKQDEKKKLCFVVGPLGEPDSDTRTHADWLLEEIVERVLDDFPEYVVVRADKIAQPGMIDAQIIRNLIEADLVIADLSALNPNAFYEIGIRHMIQKPIIHMQLIDDKIPFDVSLYRATKFSRTRPADLRRAREELKQAVKAIGAEGYIVDNPVTRARGQINLEQHATPEQKVLMEQVKSMQSRLDALEGESTVTPARPVARKRKARPEEGLFIHLDSQNSELDKVRGEVAKKLAEDGYIFDMYIDTIIVPGIDGTDSSNYWKSITEMTGVKAIEVR